MCQFNGLNTPAMFFSACDSGLACAEEWFVKSLLVQWEFIVTSMAVLPLFSLSPHSSVLLVFGVGFFFFPLMTEQSFPLVFGINATRYKWGSGDKQVLLCLFIMSSTSISTFTFCVG